MSNTILALDRNEYFFPHHPEVLNALNCLGEDSVSRYASFKGQTSFCKLLASSLSVEPHKVTLAHGAEDILVKSLAWLKSIYSSVVVEDFCWANYIHIAAGFGYEINKIPSLCSNNTYSLNISELRQFLNNSKPTLVLLTSPNNPTGHCVPITNLCALVQEFPNHFFLLDMVYSSLFSHDFLSLFSFNNMIFIGSFSKFFGMPGLRVGFAIGKLPSAFQLNLGIQPNALLACEAALKNKNWYQNNRNFMLEYASCVSEKERSRILIYKSCAPFFLAKIYSTNNLINLLSEAEIISGVRPKYIVKDGHNYIRFGLGTKEICKQIDKYLSVFD